MKLNKLFMIFLFVLFIFSNSVLLSSNIEEGIITNRVNFRSLPNTQSDILDTLQSGTKVSVIRKIRDWYEIRTSNNVQGYVHQNFINIPSSKSASRNIEDYQLVNQNQFTRIVNKFLTDYKQARNDLQKSRVRAFQQDEFKKLFAGNYNVRYWKGKIKYMRTTSAGSTYISIVLPNSSIELQNFHGRLIPVNSPLFNKIADLSVGDEIYFSGRFIKKGTAVEYISEGSWTESGAMENPWYVFIFDDVMTYREVLIAIEEKIAKQQAERERQLADFERRRPKVLKLFGIENFVLVEAGTFMMGSPTNERGRWANERQHRVTLTRDYYIGKYPVTQAQWEAVMGNNPSHFKGAYRPVERVSWNDVQEFIKKLNQMTGKNFRLPTEAEWEFAARGGNKSKGYIYSGSNNIDEVAWYGLNSNFQTQPVGRKKPNELGIYDMSGNLWEWCSDYWFGDYSSGNVTDPTGVSSGSRRVLRVGGWNSYAADCCRVARRSSGAPASGDSADGFRLVRTAP